MEQYRPMDFVILQEPQEEEHFHAGTELLYLASGRAVLRILDKVYRLDRHDVIAVNSGLRHSLHGEPGSAVCMVRYSDRLLASLYGPAEAVSFRCAGVGADAYGFEEIRQIFQELIRQYLDQSGRNICMERSVLYRLLDCLGRGFLVREEFPAGLGQREKVPEKGSRKKSVRPDESGRLLEILTYIRKNYTDNISLSELAEKMYVSPSTLSRFFKKQTGVYFADYVNQVRMKHALQGLLYSDDSITKIAVDSGFSNLSVFHRLFREEYGMSPNEYRKKMSAQVREPQEDESTLREILETEFAKETSEIPGIRDDKKQIYIDVNEKDNKSLRKVWGRTINVGSINTLLMANTQYHVLYLAENLGFRYVRLWNIFSTQMMITDGIHTENCSYDQLDIVLDFLDQHGLLPFLDFGVRPKTAVYDTEDFVYYSEENVQFQSRKAWEQAVRGVIHHIAGRYGREKAGRWIFEMAYDSIHRPRFYPDDSGFFHAYRFLYRTVREFLPEAEVGGPMAITQSPEGLVKEFLLTCREQGCVPDFVSILLFPYVSRDEENGLVRSSAAEDSFEEDAVRRIRSVMKETGVECRLYISEWNFTISSRNYLNDSCFRGAYFVRKISSLMEMTDMINVWMASDWVSNYFDVRGVANGGNGLLTKDTICKPAYYALQFLNELGDELLAKGSGYFVTKQEEGGYAVLLYHYQALKEDCFSVCAKTDDPDQVRRIYERGTPVEIEVALRSVPADRYVIRRRTISPREGSVLWEWKQFGYEENLTGEEVKYIRQICFPRLGMEKRETSGRTLLLRETLEPYEIVLLLISPEEEP